jgi:hypothetical protein
MGKWSSGGFKPAGDKLNVHLKLASAAPGRTPPPEQI